MQTAVTNQKDSVEAADNKCSENAWFIDVMRSSAKNREGGTGGSGVFAVVM